MHRSSLPAALRRLAPAVVILLAALFFAMTGTAIAASARSTGWSPVFAHPAVPAGSRPVGSLPGSTLLHGAVALRPRDPGALAAYAPLFSTWRGSVN